jgi:hypothetical protein
MIGTRCRFVVARRKPAFIHTHTRAVPGPVEPNACAVIRVRTVDEDHPGAHRLRWAARRDHRLAAPSPRTRRDAPRRPRRSRERSPQHGPRPGCEEPRQAAVWYPLAPARRKQEQPHGERPADPQRSKPSRHSRTDVQLGQETSITRATADQSRSHAAGTPSDVLRTESGGCGGFIAVRGGAAR